MKQKDLVFILSSIAIFTFFWIAFSLWHIYTTSTIKEPLTSQLTQVPSTFSTDVIEELKKRKNIIPADTLSPATPSAVPQLVTPTPTLQISPTEPVSSPSSQIP